MKKKKRIKVKLILICALLIALTSALFTAAWYVISGDRTIESSRTDVMMPYFLYLLNPDDEKSLSVSIGNIHPGEVKKMVIAVSNHNEDVQNPFEVAKENDFYYQLELAYTENLPVNYNIYELVADDNGDIPVYDERGTVIKNFSKKSINPLSSTNVSEDRQNEMYGSNKTGIVNLGKYELFEYDGDNSKLHLFSDVDKNGNVNYAMDYYMIEVKWQDGMDFSAYAKETDLVYVIVKALQPRPTEK